MMETMRQAGAAANWWLFDTHNSPKRSQWLQGTLAELDEKAKAMLTIIEEDADSFAQRADMYYKRRPELITMVEDFYRTHRSLAERFDQLRNSPGTRITSAIAGSLSFPKGHLQKVESNMCKCCDSYSDEGCGSEDMGELSEVDDPVLEDTDPIIEIDRLKEENKIQSELTLRGEMAEELRMQLCCSHKELEKLREEIERLKQEKTLIMMQREEEAKEEELSRQLSVADSELQKMREETEIQNGLILRGEKEKEEMKMQLSGANSEVQKLKEQVMSLLQGNEMAKLREDVSTQNELCGTNSELQKLREEVERLGNKNKKEMMVQKKLMEVLIAENNSQKEQLIQKDEEKKEVIRQLTLAMDVLREDVVLLKNSINAAKDTPKKRSKQSSLDREFYRFKGLAKLFSSSQKSQSSSSVVVPL